MILGCDIRIRYKADLPCSIKGFVMKVDAMSYDIYINPKQSFEEQKKTVEHEIEHIKRGDFEACSYVAQLEKLQRIK